MDSQLVAGTVAALVSLIGIIISFYLSKRNFDSEMSLRREQWQEGFRGELKRDLSRENSIRIMETRLDSYEIIWQALKVTAGYNVRRSPDIKAEIQELADELTHHAYNRAGLIMTDRSRRLLNHTREGCGDFLKDTREIIEVIDRAHLLKHSLRADLGIEDYRYENEINQIANSLGIVDDWKRDS